MVGVNLHTVGCRKEGCVVLIFRLLNVLLNVFIKGTSLLSFLISVTSEYVVLSAIRRAIFYICPDAVDTAIHSE